MTNATDEWAGHKARFLVRVMVFWGGYIVILWVASFVKAMLPEPWKPLAWGLTSSAAILPLTLLFLRIEVRSTRDIGLDLNRTSFLRLIIGVLIGSATFGIQIFVVNILAGPIHFAWAGGATPATVTAAVLGTFALSCMEELGFRGYPLRTLVLRLGLSQAQVIVAVAFGLCHLAFGWSWSTILLGVMPSALLFGMAAVSSRGLAMPIGLHAGLNLAQSSLSGNSGWGFCKLMMEDKVRDRVATVAPLSGVGVVILVMLAFWRWHQSRPTGKVGSNAA